MNAGDRVRNLVTKVEGTVHRQPRSNAKNVCVTWDGYSGPNYTAVGEIEVIAGAAGPIPGDPPTSGKPVKVDGYLTHLRAFHVEIAGLGADIERVIARVERLKL